MLVSFTEAEVKFIICGGVAAVLHGVERMTLDLDISIDMKQENIKRFINVLKDTQLEPRVPIPSETLLDPEKINTLIKEKNARVFTFTDPEKPWKQVDIFLTEDYSYNRLLSDSVTIEIGGYPMLVISKEKLIAMKRGITPLRSKDALDINELLGNKGDTQ